MTPGHYVEADFYLQHTETTAYATRVDISMRTRRTDDAGATGDPFHSAATFNLHELRQHETDPVSYGERLSKQLFSDPDLLAEFVRVRTIAQVLNLPLRVRLRLDKKAPHLHELRWETLRDPARNTSLLMSEKILFARHLDTDQENLRPVQLPHRDELRAVVVVANPSNLAEYQLEPLSVSEELARASNGLGDIPFTTLVDPGSATLNNLLDNLRNGCNLLYLVCHGRLRKQSPTLYLENKSARVEPVPAADFINAVEDAAQPPVLVVLASCQSAGAGQSSDGGALAALGPGLIRAGVPVVVAMQDNVTVDTIGGFTPVFFRELRRDGQIDRALAVARSTIRRQPDWWVPVLFMRLEDGRLFIADEARTRVQAPFHVEPPPPEFITRPEKDVLNRRLMQSSANGPLATAVVGMGGSGKSTLVRAVAHGPEVRDHFRDGILWVTLGQEADVLAALVDRLQALGDHDFRATTLEAAAQRLGHLLQDKKLLLVLDDAWYARDVEPFLRGGPDCHVLLTTRRQEVAKDVGAMIMPLGVLNREQSLQLLTTLLARDLDKAEQRDALTVARAVGYLPLALKLVAVRISGGTSWQSLQLDLQAEVARLEALEPSRRRRRKGELRLQASLISSLNWLRREDEEAWRAFIALGVLPEDAAIAAPMAATAWAMRTVEDAAHLLAFLQEEALLISAGQQHIGNRIWPIYTLHDLFHDLARRLLTTPLPDGLGQSLPRANAALLAQYRARTQNNNWHTLPDDGYIHRLLTGHLRGAGWEDEIHQLLREENDGGHNGWYEARDALGQPAGFVADVLDAWRLTEEEPPAFGLQCRYALIIATLNSLASNIPTTLMGRLLLEGYWTPPYAFEYARQIGDPELRVRALAVVLPHLSETLCERAQEEAVLALREIHGPAFVQALKTLRPVLPPSVLGDVLSRLSGLQNSRVQADALQCLMPILLPEQVEAALTEARAIAGPWDRARALACLAHTCNRTELFAEALETAGSVRRQPDRAGAFAAVLAYLPAEERPAALQLAGSISFLEERAWIWAQARLLPFFSQQEQEDRLQKLLPVAIDMAFERLYYQWPAVKAVKPLLEVTPFLRDSEREEIWARAFQQIDIYDERRQLLRHHADILPSALVAEQSLILLEDATGPDAAAFVDAVAPYLPLADVQDGELVSRIEEVLDPEKVYPLALLIAHLPPERRPALARTALKRISGVSDIALKLRVIAALAPALEGADLKQALRAVQEVDDEPQRHAATKALSSCTEPAAPADPSYDDVESPVDNSLQAIMAAQVNATSSEEAARLLAEAAPQYWYGESREKDVTNLVDRAVAAGYLRVALDALPLIEDETVRALWLIALIPYMEVDALSQLYTFTWDEHWAPGSYYYKLHVRAGVTLPLLDLLETDPSHAPRIITALQQASQDGAIRGLPDDLARHLRAVLLNLGLRAARDLFDSEEKAHLLARLATALPPDKRRGVSRQALNVILRMAEFTTKLSKGMEWDALDERRPYAGRRFDPLTGIAAVLPEEMLAEALQRAVGMAYPVRRAQIVGALAPNLPPSLFSTGLNVVRGLHAPRLRTGVLLRLAPAMPAGDLPSAFDLANGITSENLRLQALVALLQRASEVDPTLASTYWPWTLRLASRLARPRFLEHLRALADVLHTLGGAEAIVEARRAVEDVGRWWP